MPSPLSKSSDAIFPDWSGKRQSIEKQLESKTLRDVDAEGAEKELRRSAPNSFIFRLSSQVGKYTLTLVGEKRKLYHFRYQVKGPIIFGLGKEFRSLAGFISYAILTTKKIA